MIGSKNLIGRAAPVRRALLPWLLIVGSGLLSPGCSTTEQAQRRVLATVEIHGNTPGQIQPAAVEVFQKDGYQLAQRSASEMVFEKLGSGWHNFAYGDWLGTPMWVRVKLQFAPITDQGCRVDCRAYLVRDRGGATEEELPVGKSHHKDYQKVLDDLAARFEQRAS
jgi:hypothetical protein